MYKNDMHTRVSDLSETDSINLVKSYHIPLDLHHRFPDPNLTMDRLPTDAIDRIAIPDYLTWRHSYSCVSNDFPLDGYDQNDVERLCVHLTRLHEMKEAVLFRSGLSSVWSNQKCDPVFRRTSDHSEMSIYDFITLPTWGDAKIVEEPHQFPTSILECVQNNTTVPAIEGTPVPLPTPNEVVAAQPDHELAKKSKASVKRKDSSSLVVPSGPDQPAKKKWLRKKASKAGSSAPILDHTENVEGTDISDFCADIENSLERDEGTSFRAVSAPFPRLGKRLGSPPYWPHAT
ncbi:hypothetical protein Tco_1572437, partial [Tanacetum coccineum]